MYRSNRTSMTGQIKEYLPSLSTSYESYANRSLSFASTEFQYDKELFDRVFFRRVALKYIM